MTTVAEPVFQVPRVAPARAIKKNLEHVGKATLRSSNSRYLSEKKKINLARFTLERENIDVGCKE